MTEEEFYQRCGEILGAVHEGQAFPYYHRTRWNNRKPGRGRYPGRGVVRAFGDTVHIALSHPQHTQIVNGKERALEVLQTIIKDKS